MEFSTDGESLPSSQKHRHSAIHVTRSDGVFACCSTSCSNSCSCRRCCLLLDSAAAAAAAESENNNKERREGEGMEEEQQTEPEPLEDEQDCCVFKQHCQQVLPGGEVTTNRADLNSVSSFYMDSNISEGESDMEDIQVRKQKQPHALHYSLIPWLEITKTRRELLLVKSCSVVRINNISDFN